MTLALMIPINGSKRDLDMTDVTLDPLCCPRRSCGARSESESAQQCVSSDHVIPTHHYEPIWFCQSPQSHPRLALGDRF